MRAISHLFARDRNDQLRQRAFGISLLESQRYPDENDPMLPECQLFGTLGCHLCELSEAVVMPLVERGLLVELLDIADRPEWVDDYGLRIPVLRRVDTGIELDWPFDTEDVVRFLR